MSQCRSWGGSLLHGISEELLVPADGSIELVVRLLHRPRLLKALPGEGAREKRNRHIDGEHALGVDVARDNGRLGPHGKAMPDRPVLDGLDEIILLGLFEGWRVLLRCDGCGCHCAEDAREDGM